jgi:aminotransferase
MPETDLALKNHQLDQLVASPIRAFNNRIATIPGIIKLTVGELDFDVAPRVKEAAVEAILHEDAHYVPGNGAVGLLEAIADELERTTGQRYDPATEIVVTLGVSEGLYVTLQALFNPGDAIVVPTPTFSLYETQAEMLGISVIAVNTAPTFMLSADQLRQVVMDNPSVKAVALNSPGNPTGVVYSKEALVALAEVARELGLLIISDDIYADFAYDAPAELMAQLLPEQTIVLNGLSKSHAMPGYRIGYVAGPAALMSAVSQVHRAVVTSAPNPMMAAATAALTAGGADVVRYRDVMRERRDLVVDTLTALGLTHAPVAGALYAFVKVPARFGTDDVAFALRLAEAAKIGVTPGSIFGPGGEGYIRLSFAVADDELREALSRLRDYLKEN